MGPDATRFVNKRMVVTINKMCVSISGGLTHGGNAIRDGAALGFVDWIHTNEVFGQPLYADIFHQAAAYMFYVIKNHIFLDGNKRTGLACAVTFLEWNGVVFAPFDEDAVFDFVISVAAGPNDPDTALPSIAAWFSSMSLH
ncbi:MAG: prophage maintenance system killer protein [Myxococcota bacterium]|jgi:prophage maintenance system killer protein